MTGTAFVRQAFWGGLWNTALICAVLGAKWLLRNRLSIRTQYRSWYFLAVSLLLPFFPFGILRGFLPVGVGLRRAFTISASSNFADYTLTSGDEWLRDTTILRQHPEADRIALVLLIVWGVGTLLMTLLYCLGNRRLYRTAKSAFNVSSQIQKEFEKIRMELKVNFNVTLCQSHFFTSPISFWWGHFFMILPADRLKKLSNTDLKNILRHELTHISHGDPLAAYLFCGIQTIFWCHPLVWIAFRQMRREREVYCDWDVMNSLSDEKERIRYGQTILNFAAIASIRFCTADGLCQGKKQLKYRLEHIVDFREDTARKGVLGKCCAVLLTVVVIGQLPFLSVCADASETYYVPPSGLVIEEADWSQFFNGKDGCAVLYDQRADHYTVYNKDEVFRRVPPCSTYKPYSALNALEQVGLLRELCSNGFGADPENIVAVKEAIALNEGGFYGKTGTGRLEDANIAGWFVGFVESAENTRFIAVYLNSPEGADGAAAYEIACHILEKI